MVRHGEKKPWGAWEEICGETRETELCRDAGTRSRKGCNSINKGMERQAAYDLLKCFLENRSTQGIDCKKDLPGLLAYGVTKGCFINPDTVFEQTEWCKFGDKLFDEVNNENKTAKKLLKPWRAVTNALAIHQAEQRVAAAATERLGLPGSAGSVNPQQGGMGGAGDYPLPPSVRTITLPQGAMGASSSLIILLRVGVGAPAITSSTTGSFSQKWGNG